MITIRLSRQMYILTYSCTYVMCFSCFSYFFISDGASVIHFFNDLALVDDLCRHIILRPNG